MDSQLEGLLTGLEGLVRRVEAQQFWLSQAYYLISGDRPGEMAALIEMKLRSLMNEPPAGPAGMQPAELDAVMLQELPAVLCVGKEMAELLRATQRLMDQKRAEARSTSPV